MSLTSEIQNTLFALDEIDTSWKPFFIEEQKKPYFELLLNNITKEYKTHLCWPDQHQVLRLFREISLPKIKIVILGQDPYHTPKVADGLAFSVHPRKSGYIPGSLKNILLELQRDLKCNSFFFAGDLSPWLQQGVFLLNASLTVRYGVASSHLEFWKPFVTALINFINKNNPYIVWIFWGKKAQKLQQECGIEKTRSIVSAHPSPFSAASGFFFSQPFSKANALLLQLNRTPVDWLVVIKKQ